METKDIESSHKEPECQESAEVKPALLDHPLSSHQSSVQRRQVPIRLVVSRFYTVSVLVAFVILLFTDKSGTRHPFLGSPPKGKPNGTTHTSSPSPPLPHEFSFKISDLGSLRSALTAAVIGAGCNLFQLSALAYLRVTGKHKAIKYMLFFDYYCDKAVALLLAASAGASIGAMLDVGEILKQLPIKSFGGLFSLGKISTTLMVSAMVSTSVSSTWSSEALQDYKRTIDRGQKAVGILGGWASKLYNYCCHCC